MEKTNLNGFIQRYSLAGSIESVIWKSDGSSLTTSFISDDNTLIGEVILNEVELESADIPIFDTTKLKTMIGVLNEDISISFRNNGERNISMKLSDNKVDVNFVLAQESVIKKAPELKQTPPFDVKVKLDSAFVNRFIKSKTALANEDKFTIHTKDGKHFVTIGYSGQETNRISLEVELEEPVDNIEPISFSAKYLKEILVSNKDAESAFLNVSSQGLLQIGFKTDEFVTNYYLIKIEDN